MSSVTTEVKCVIAVRLATSLGISHKVPLIKSWLVFPQTTGHPSKPPRISRPLCASPCPHRPPPNAQTPEGMGMHHQARQPSQPIPLLVGSIRLSLCGICSMSEFFLSFCLFLVFLFHPCCLLPLPLLFSPFLPFSLKSVNC